VVEREKGKIDHRVRRGDARDGWADMFKELRKRGVKAKVIFFPATRGSFRKNLPEGEFGFCQNPSLSAID